jgi:hypothetical protein
VNGDRFYFAYGSNMSTEYLHRWIQNHIGSGTEFKLDVVGNAILDGYRVRADYYAPGQGKSCERAMDIVRDSKSRVEGVLYLIDEMAMSAIKDKEGFPTDYFATHVIVSCGGSRRIAITFERHVTVDKLKGTNRLPDRYKDLVLNGARDHGLSEPYQQMLKEAIG